MVPGTHRPFPTRFGMVLMLTAPIRQVRRQGVDLLLPGLGVT